MANFNKVILAGNLTRDPELRYLPNQTAVVDLGLAVNHKFRTANGEDRDKLIAPCVCICGQNSWHLAFNERSHWRLVNDDSATG